MNRHNHLNIFIQEAIRQNWESPALTNFNGSSFLYKDVARKIAKLHILFEETGIRQSDRIALCGKNSAQWAIMFLAAVTYGAVIVPILHEFKADNIHHLLNHSDARLLFVDNSIWENLDPSLMENILGVFHIKDFSLLFSRDEKISYARGHLNEMFGHRYPDRFTPDDVVYHSDATDELAMISYTSGSTGFSKGVMLTYGNLWSNLKYCRDYLRHIAGEGVVMMLPLAHLYGLTIDLIHPFCSGCHIYFLTRTPSPRIIMEAFAQVKPRIVVSVPLILEKIIKTKVFPLLDKPLMKLLMHVPFVDDHLLARIKNSLTASFGGNLQEIIIGGAALNKEVEAFLKKIGFPFTIGYGMTECAPLISYCPWHEARLASCGRCVDRMELRIDSPDPLRVPGVLYVKGANMMKGYYKNDEATGSIMTPDGWMSTGDICTIDEDGFIYIHGRDKNMILGPSGQNIFPEEIEEKLNNMPYVSESIVVDGGGGKLVALIYPDIESTMQQKLQGREIEQIMHDNIQQLNKMLPAYSQICQMKIYDEEFEKTAKRSIKRYLYQNSFNAKP